MHVFRLTFVIAMLMAGQLHAAEVDFNRDIRPLLNQHCVACHGGVKQAGDVSFVYRDLAMIAIEPGSPEDSTLLERVTMEDGDERMPPPEHGRRLNSKEVGLLKRWIEEGAEWGEHWSFVAPKTAELPASDKEPWSKSRIDHFIYDQLKVNQLQPSPEAKPETWLRRVTIDLTGVPPTLEERQAFLSQVEQDGEQAYQSTVDRLLKSPRFGERWASMWLDAVRYADSRGLGQDGKRTMWKYRDWVIQAFNDDMPFDQFTIKQIAGDLLPDASLNDLVATACHRLTQTNEEGGTDDEQFRLEAVLDRVNTTWTTWQGLTFGCVQCHAHPYDPIQHNEYYEAIAFFNNTDDWDLTDDAPHVEVPVELQDYAKFESLVEQIDALNKEEWQSSFELLQKEENWSQLTGLELKSSNTTRYELVNVDGVEEFRTVGTVARDTKLNITAPIPAGMEKLTAVRFTALPIDLEKAKLNPEMGFVVSYFSGNLLSEGKEPIPLEFAYVISDEFSSPMDPQESLDRKSKDGFGAFTRMNYPRAAAFVLLNPMVVPANARIEIEVSQNVFDLDSFPLVANRGRIAVSDRPVFTDWLHSPERASNEVKLKQWLEEKSKIKTVMIPQMRERPNHLARPTAVFERGDFLNKGELVQPNTPEFLPPLAAEGTPTRLDFARWLASAKNPLTARVAVNRFWSQLFGVGLVETQEDFGSSGDDPSHPQLLDDLAARFADEMQWSVKSLLRELVLSATYRQQSNATQEQLAADPSNRWLGRGPRVRLPAETIRDQALAISGLLCDTMFGPPTYPPLPEGVWQPFQGGEKWETPEVGNPERYRRTIYSYTKRSIPLPIMTSFDAPSREFCSARRLKSNTPLQALMTLNDITFVEAAQAFANRMIASATTLEEQIRKGFVIATCREPSPEELTELTKLYQTQVSNSTKPDVSATETNSTATSELAAMESVAIVLLNLDELFTN